MKRVVRQGRRSFVTGLGLLTVGMAGCLSNQQNEAETPTSESGTSTETPAGTPDGGSEATETPEEPTDTPGKKDLAWAIKQGTLIDTFNDFEKNWTVEDGKAKLSNRTAFSGDASVLLDTTGVNRVRISRQFETSKDFRNHDLSLAVKPLESNMGRIQVRVQLLGLFGGTHTVSGMIDTDVKGRWVRLDFGFDSENGGNLRAIKKIRIYCWDGEDGSSKFYVDDLRIVEKPEKGVVMFNFLGGNPGDYKVAYPTLKEFGWTGNVFPPSGGVDGGEPPTPNQYKQMMAEGWIVGGYTVGREKLTNFSTGDQNIVFEENRRQLEKKGLLGDHVPFVPPYDAYNAATLDTVLDHFDSMYVSMGRSSTSSATVTDPRTIGTVGGNSLEDAKSSVDAAANYRQLAALNIRMDEINEKQLTNLCQHVNGLVNDGKIDVLNAKQHFNRFATPSEK